ncbi:polyprenyl synthetase family protein [Rhodoluna sp.]|uniref:polyprenyl synthetase family protein n=1 Tax=Rhodoluna sp. TaxID=1969481 RepID=UPI0026002FA2|nr:polyprenyl synthetase family protein [Rhodoluna sp.]
MSETKVLLSLIQEHLDSFLAQRRDDFVAISPDLSTVVSYSHDLLQGGKRFRALFCYWAWAGALGNADIKQNEAQRAQSAEAIVGITAALEMFHGAALVHDDLLDQSDTRRGAPAVHKRFERLHQESNWSGSHERFGVAGSVLVGDLMLGWSSEIFGNALLKSPDTSIETACREEFSKMRVEVMAGQYLDVVEENAAMTRPADEAVGRANRVILYKTAKYTLEAPMLIGAAFAGASPSLLRGLSAFAIPLGMAFQLRDDILGVFGDPQVTGKPAGDDLREGKRTVLVALTRESLSTSVGRIFDEMLCQRNLDQEQITFLQQTIVGSGALAKTERMIEELGDESLNALESLEIDQRAKDELRALALKVIDRES